MTGALPSLQELVERARDGARPLHEQHAAFGVLVERTQHLVFGRAVALLGSFEETRDAAQDAYMAAWLGLPRLREPAAFPGWLSRIVVTQCHRRLRRKKEAVLPEPDRSIESHPPAMRGGQVSAAVRDLPAGERHVMLLFYVLGYKQEEIARLLGLKTGTVGKRLHSARLRIRRRLPASLRRELLPRGHRRAFVRKVQRGLFDQYVGRYRFDRRPDHVVTIRREGDALVSEGGGQRHLLSSVDDASLLAIAYDGEGRFHRDRKGRVTHFVYYEFGRRLGIARRCPV